MNDRDMMGNDGESFSNAVMRCILASFCHTKSRKSPVPPGDKVSKLQDVLETGPGPPARVDGMLATHGILQEFGASCRWVPCSSRAMRHRCRAGVTNRGQSQP